MRMLPDRESQNRALSLGVLLLVPLVSFAIWYAVTTPPEHDDEFPGILQRYGYSAMALPSRLFGPGTIMTVETLRSGALDLHLACRIDDPGLEAKWQRSPAMNLSFAAGVRRAFKSSVLASHLIEYGLVGERANATDLSLQDIEIVTLPYDDLIALRGKYLKDTCEAAVVWNLRRGAKVCQSEEVLQADVIYMNASQDRFGGTGKLDLIEEAGASVDVDHKTSVKRTANGDDLFLGIKVRLNHCFTLTESGRNLVGSL